MNNEENLNTESNGIAGNPVGGPAGNTAARPRPVSTSATGPAGSPTQLPTPASIGGPGTPAPTSSESLAASETSVGKGGVSGAGKQDNQPVDPSALKEPARRGRKPGTTNKPKDAPQAAAKPRPAGKKGEASATRQPDNYGGNFGNDVQGSYQDEARYDNQASDASRGEFGTSGRQATHATHGGYGNQNREADYDRRHSAEDQYYGGPGRYGAQHNAYRDYDGRNERWDERPNYGYERGFHPADGYDRREPHDRPRGNFGNGYDDYQGRQHQSGNYNDGRGNSFDNRNQPDRDDRYSGRQNDNGSRQGHGAGYADDYGRSSLGGHDPYGRPRYDDYRDERRGGNYPQPGAPRRNQDEDYRSSRGGYDNQGSSGGRGGHREDDYGYGQRGGAASPGQRNNYGEGYGYGHNRNEQSGRPDYRTGDDRNGYGRSYGGDSSQGYGSRGGSYNDNYDDSRPGSNSGSPARGDYRREDAARNYGPGQRPPQRPENDEDYGPMPRRNRGRDGQGDE